MHYLTAYPFATASSLAAYLLFAALIFPPTARWLKPRLVLGGSTTAHVNAFDAIRGLAAAFVAMAHCWWATAPVFQSTQLVFPFFQYGPKAVSVFAMLSGFLIFRSVARIAAVADVRAYIVRRIFRIYPVYLLGIALGIIVGLYFSTGRFSGLGFFVAELFMFYAIDWPEFSNPPAWSLYSEVMFYAVLPLLTMLVTPRRMLAVSLIAIVAIVIAAYPSRHFGIWLFFFTGIAASELTDRVGRYALPLFIAGMALLLLDVFVNWADLLHIYPTYGNPMTLGLAVAGFMVLVALPHLGRIAGALEVLPLRVLGSISYSVYILHFFYIYVSFPEVAPFVQAGTPEKTAYFASLTPEPFWYMPLLFFPGILFWGTVSYLIVERPGIQFGHRLARRIKGDNLS